MITCINTLFNISDQYGSTCVSMCLHLEMLTQFICKLSVCNVIFNDYMLINSH